MSASPVLEPPPTRSPREFYIKERALGEGHNSHEHVFRIYTTSTFISLSFILSAIVLHLSPPSTRGSLTLGDISFFLYKTLS